MLHAPSLYPALAALAAVVREGGFERAAAVLGVTPSAVSQRVRGLEERVGTTLVVRSQPPMPTKAGARLCAHFEQVRLMERELAGDLPALAGAEGGERTTLRIAVNADSLASWLVPAIARFAERTGVLLDVLVADEAHTAERLRSGDVLAAVTADPKPVAGCRTRPLGALRYLATASPGFARRHFAAGVDAGALARAPVLRFDRSDDLQARWAAGVAGTPCGTPLVAPTHWIPSAQAFLDACLAGLGWALNPSALAAPLVAAGRLVELVPNRPLDVPLHWQHTRVAETLIGALTRDVLAQARQSLVPLA